VSSGTFSAYVGDGAPLALDVFKSHSVVFVGILVADDASELKPLIQLGSVPYAAQAAFCGDADKLGGKTAAELQFSGPKGDQGPQGIQGIQGIQGDQGPRGAPGAPGAQGAAGAQGAQGAQGGQGPKGDAGAAGAKGDTGAKGDRGDTGPAGVLSVNPTGRISASLAGQSLAIGFKGPDALWNGQTMTVSANAKTNYGWTNNLAPTSNGGCMVTAHAWINGSNASVTNWLSVAVQTNGGTITYPVVGDPATGGGVPFAPQVVGNVSAIVQVSTGTSYRFGCAVMNNTASNSAACVINVLCL
jgi:hypothetical protein